MRVVDPNCSKEVAVAGRDACSIVTCLLDEIHLTARRLSLCANRCFLYASCFCSGSLRTCGAVGSGRLSGHMTSLLEKSSFVWLAW
jgi:hypothetical protein